MIIRESTRLTPSLRAGTGLLVWVTAISKYFDVAKNVGPRVA